MKTSTSHALKLSFQRVQQLRDARHMATTSPPIRILRGFCKTLKEQPLLDFVTFGCLDDRGLLISASNKAVTVEASIGDYDSTRRYAIVQYPSREPLLGIALFTTFFLYQTSRIDSEVRAELR